MDITTTASRRFADKTEKEEKSVFLRLKGLPSNNNTAVSYVHGKQSSRIMVPNDRPRKNPSPYYRPPKNSLVAKNPNYGFKRSPPKNSLAVVKPDDGPRKRSLVWTRGGGAGSDDRSNQKKGVVVSEERSTQNNGAGPENRVTQKDQNKVCKFWISGNCVKDAKCRFLHSWCRGDGFSMLAKLGGHEKAVTGITLPLGSDKLYSGSVDGTARVWDCHTGHCARVMDHGDKIGSLISEGPWVFVGMPNVVKALNIQTSAEFSLKGPVGQVNAMVVANNMLFAGAQDGIISAWKGDSETNPFQLAASMEGHTRAVICLTVRSKTLYSGSMDHTIRVWDLDTLQSIMTLNGHTDAVMSLLCWDQYLLSCSLDQTIKVWFANEEGNLEVTYTHKEEHGLLALCGMNDTEAKPILLCSCNDNSVHLYELPSFTERGRLFSKQEVREIQTGPDGLFFTGDGTGMLTVWKCLALPIQGELHEHH